MKSDTIEILDGLLARCNEEESMEEESDDDESDEESVYEESGERLSN